MRIWSLLPSATEILFALGLDEQVTGVTHECDYPPQAAGKPRVTVSFVDSSRKSRDVDEQVVRRLTAGEPLYAIDEERLRADPPDLIVTQDLCPVCAVSPSDFAGHLESTGCRAEVVCLNPHRLEDVLDDVRSVGAAADRAEEAERVVAGLRERIEAVKTALEGARRPRVLCLEWLDPPIPAGHWVPEMARLAGGETAFVEPGEPARKVPWEELRAYQPEVVVLMPCGFGPTRAIEESAALTAYDGWFDLPAVQKGRVYAVDGNAHFSRPGPRLVEGLEILARILHSDRWRKAAPPGSVLKLVSPPAGSSSVENWPARFRAVLVMMEQPARPKLRLGPVHFPEQYDLPPRPSGAPVAALDAHRQTEFLLANDLDLFQRVMNLQLAIARGSAKPKGPEAAAVLGLWSRAFAYLADACTLMARGSYVSCFPIIRAACDAVAVQKSLIAKGFAEYREWLERAVAQDRDHAALAVDLGRYRAGSALAQEPRLAAVYRPVSDLAMPHFGSTALQVGPETSLQRLSLAFADTSFHLGFAELITGWLLALADIQLETAVASGVLPLSQEARREHEVLRVQIESALASPRRCHVEEVGGRFLFYNFRRASGSAPKRVLL
ncbi:MAG: cobalamin-binding protein [Chloroflexi bacterium]|nr:cobalamin-binding protein [Chloroflexota bacterium]